MNVRRWSGGGKGKGDGVLTTVLLENGGELLLIEGVCEKNTSRLEEEGLRQRWFVRGYMWGIEKRN